MPNLIVYPATYTLINNNPFLKMFNFSTYSWSWCKLKVVFFQKVWCVVQISKKRSKSLSWAWNLNFPPIKVDNLNKLSTVMGGKFKFQVKVSLLEYLFLEIWRFDKHITLSEKKQPLVLTIDEELCRNSCSSWAEAPFQSALCLLYS